MNPSDLIALGILGVILAAWMLDLATDSPARERLLARTNGRIERERARFYGDADDELRAALDNTMAGASMRATHALRRCGVAICPSAAAYFWTKVPR